MNPPQQQRSARVRWRLIKGIKRFAQQGFRDQGPVGRLAVFTVEQAQHELTHIQRAGGGVLRLFRGSSGFCATAIGHDPL